MIRAELPPLMKPKLSIWLVTVGEPLPEDAEGETRLLRTGQFADWLAERGHDVTFITNSVDHARRRQRFDQTTVLVRSVNYRVVCLYSRVYPKTISVTRFLSHRDAARSFYQWYKSNKPGRPDVILASYPTPEICNAALRYAHQHQVPVVVDVRDLWPDIFWDLPKRMFKPLARFILKPFDWQVKRILGKANAVSGMSPAVLNWALDKASRKKSDDDFLFYFTYSGRTLSAKQLAEAQHARPKNDKLRFIFFGTLSRRSTELDRIIAALGDLTPEEKARTELVVCGLGDAKADLEVQVAKTGAPVVFRGWVQRDEIIALSAQSDFGVLPYSRPEFQKGFPNKFSEYLACGLPVFSCTDGSVRAFINENGCGIWVPPDRYAIRDEIARLIAAPRSRDLSNAALRAYAEHFDADKTFGTVLQSLRKISEAKTNWP